MSKYPEYFVVAFGHADPNVRQRIQRYAQDPGEPPGSHFERAKSKQRWLKFEGGYRCAFLYEAWPMTFVDGEFVSACSSSAQPTSREERSLNEVERVLAQLPPIEEMPEREDDFAEIEKAAAELEDMELV